MIAPETVILLTQLIRLGADGLSAGANGDKTDAEILADIEKGVKDMHENVRQASQRWRQ